MIPGSKLACSFCGKSEKDVAKLMGGANAHICDVCVGVCTKILEATPQTFAGWDAMSNDQLLASLKPSAATVDATREVLQSIVYNLRQRGISWEVIGRTLGMSRQAAWERFS